MATNKANSGLRLSFARELAQELASEFNDSYQGASHEISWDVRWYVEDINFMPARYPGQYAYEVTVMNSDNEELTVDLVVDASGELISFNMEFALAFKAKLARTMEAIRQDEKASQV